MSGHQGVSGMAWRLLGAVMLIASLMAVPAYAQNSIGTILGTVKDASGGVVAGATVTVQNTETGLSRSVNTGDDGAYRFSALPVGHYDVKTERSGFKPVTQKGLVLDVSQEAVLNFALEVGTASQSVEVTGEAPLVNTTTATLGGLVNEEKITELPLNGRSYQDLTLLQPGISASTTVIHLGGGSSGTIYSSNGAPVISNNFLLDGTPMQTVLGLNGSSAYSSALGIDGVREYKVVTNAFGAEYGMNMGSQMLVVSKGGGNQFHGDVFEYLRNRVLDARNFFDTSYQQTGAKRNPQYERNNFGGAFGGPIKKDKTFFWAVYEGLRQTKGSPVTVNSIPAACHTANHMVDSSCDISITTPFMVPTAIQPLLDLYPIPPSSSSNQFTYTFTSPASVNFGQIRVDHNFTKDDSFFARYTMEQGSEVVPAPGNDPSNAVPYGYKQFEDNWYSRNQYLTLSESHIFSPVLLNTLRLSYSRTSVPTNYIITDPAVTSDLVSFAGGGKPIGLLVLGANNGNPGGITTLGPDLASPNYHLQNYLSLGDDLFYTKGKHALKFGVLINRINMVIGETVFDRGRLNFISCTDSSIPLGCFLHNEPSLELGATKGASTSPTNGIERRHFNYYTYGFYGQDDWRATSRLTLNLGLRYEFNTTIREAHGLESSFRDLDTNPATTYTQGPLMRNGSLRNFSPRVGFAYDVTGSGKTSIRGAFGLYYDVATIGQTTFVEVVGDPPFRAINGNPAAGTFAPGFLQGPAFVGPFAGPGTTSTYPQFPGYSPFLALNGYDDYNAKQPYLMQWNLSADRQLPGGVALTVSYVGTRGVHLWNQQEGNPCKPDGYEGPGNKIPFWTGPCEGPQAVFPSLPHCPTPPFSFFWGSKRATCNLGFVQLITTNSRSWYDGLQMSVQKKLAHGLEFQSAYTWSQTLDTAQGQLFIDGEIRSNNTTLNIDKGRSKFAAAHNWRFNTLYHFPGIKSGNFGAKLLNGWWMGNIISLQSGYAFTPLLLSNQSLSGVAGGQADRPNIIADPLKAGIVAANPDPNCQIVSNGTNSGRAPASIGTPQAWFNPCAFAPQPLGHLGNASRGMLTGPRLFDWTFSINKDTKILALGEAGNLQFRAEFFNLLNRANFGLPNPVSGQIFQASDGRDIQLALKLNF